MNKVAQNASKAEQKLKEGIKRYIYDIVAAIIILVIIAASLHILDIYNMSDGEEIKNFLVDWIPYFFATILLNMDMYEKGAFVGKGTLNYKDALTEYSTVVTRLNGAKLSAMGEFCIWYNEKALKERRQDILRKEGIDYNLFENEFKKKVDDEDKIFKPLKLWSKKELDEVYGVNARKCIFQAKNTKVKGVNVNILLSSFDVKDPTNIGSTEIQLKKTRNISTTIRYLFISGLMSIVFIKDVSQWKWTGLLEVIFKVAYVFARASMSYFKAYNDITISVANHIVRKTDILNEFDTWYNNQSNIK